MLNRRYADFVDVPLDLYTRRSDDPGGCGGDIRAHAIARDEDCLVRRLEALHAVSMSCAESGSAERPGQVRAAMDQWAEVGSRTYLRLQSARASALRM
jgi:hypothetical protein